MDHHVIYLTTGANGACKTLITIWEVRQQQLKEPHRPVFYNGFEMVQKYADEFGWKPFDPKEWQALPDGSICIMDECQNEFPPRGTRDPVPDYVNAVAQFRRKRGFDFYMITPHPSLIDVFIRKLIASPSYHRHFKRIFGGEMSMELRFDAVDLKCDERNSGTRAQCTTRNFPKEAYDWYRSASLHTGKKKIPKQLYVLGACIALIPVMIWGAYSMVTEKGKETVASAGTVQQAQDVGGLKRPMTTFEYVDSFKPRIGGFPHSAPRYDEITKPVLAPYPAACLVMAGECRCYSQQATRLVVSRDVCHDIAEKGFFVDWQQQVHAPSQLDRTAQPVPLAASPAARTVPVPVTPAPVQPSHTQGLVATNAQARAEMGGYGPRMAESVSVLGR